MIYFPRDGPWITISFSSKASNLKVTLAVDKLHGGGSRMITNGDALQGDKGAILVLRHRLQSCSWNDRALVWHQFLFEDLKKGKPVC